ncbi:MAG TPA: FlgD immunoglobulin-like domain containing protein [Candidatus Kapabacteria bacterium]|nr:FlgD immunoglobulin-like domain containing protein [Candidatus Kapabacteria bacterium]
MPISKHFISFFAALALLSWVPSVLRAQAEAGGESLPAPIVSLSDSGAYGAINQLPASIRSSRPFAREFYEFARHAGSSGTVDNAAYRSTFEEARNGMLQSSERAMKGTRPQNILSGGWTNLGLTGSDAVPSAGITTAIVFDPQNPAIMYAGGSGGVWKSFDTGANWFPLTDNVLPNLSVASIAIDPVNPDTLYVGTGYCYSSTPMYNGAGLYESTDSGQSFSLVNVASGAESFVKVVVDPSNHNIILASSFDQRQVYRSTNFGATWNSVFSKGGVAWDILSTPGPGNSSIFYLLCGGDPSFGGTGSGGIYKSTDDGGHWSIVTTVSNFLAASSIGRGALASPARDSSKIFALVTDPGGSQVHLYESTDAGTNWAPYTPAPSSTLFNQVDLTIPAQGWYDLTLAVSPYSRNSDTIYIGGISAYVMSGASGWNAYSSPGSNGDGGNGMTHVDHHSFAFNPVNSRIVYDGDDGGLWVNYAAGSTDVSNGGGWLLHSHNMVTSRLYNFTFDHFYPTHTWAGAQDQGLWEIISGQDPMTFPDDHLGDAMQPLGSSQNPTLVYAEGVQGEIYEASLPGAWTSIGGSSVFNDAVGWAAPFRMSPVAHLAPIVPSSSILYIGRQRLWQTTNGGKNWTKLTPSFGAALDGLYYCTAIGLPSWNANMIYAAGGGSSFQLSTDFGVNWRTRTNPGIVTSINTSPQDPKFVVVTLSSSSKKVMMSDDSGHTWTDVSGTTAGQDIPGAGANTQCNVMSLAIDSTNPLTTWYAATDFGMYETTNAGQSWSFMGPGLFPCRDVQIASNGVTMRVATYGRGLWETTLVPDAVESVSLSATKGPGGTNLSWNVEGEPSGAMFYIQRSLDGDAFVNIGSIPGFGAASARQDYSFADNTTEPGTYLYQIHEVDANGAEHYTNQVELHYGTDGIYFSQPYPNPFVLNGNATGDITLTFELPARDNVLVRIYNTNGVLVRTLLDHPLDGGPHSLTWDARDAGGSVVEPGAYLCSIQTGASGRVTNKIMIVRE